MTTETINGLHRCQPKNEPQQGQVKTFLVIHNPAKQGKKPWIAIKSAAEDKGGTPYKVVSVESTGWEPDQYGNQSYNLEIEAANGTYQQAKAAMQGDPQDYGDDDSMSQRIDAARKQGTLLGEPGYKGFKGEPLPHESPPARPSQQGTVSMLDERQRAIIRQHSQSMALEVLKLKVTLNELTVEDLTPAKLRKLADYFDQDVIGAAE